MTPSDFLSGKQLAAALNVPESTLSEAATSGNTVRGYPVADWADRSESGRVQGYRVPADVADWLSDTEPDFEPVRAPEPAVQPVLTLPAPPPVIHVAAPEPDKTFDRLRDGYDHMLARTEREVERLQSENARLRDDFFRLRDDARAQATEASERINSLRLSHMEELNALRFQAMETKTELRIAEEGLSDDRSTVERLFETHGESFFGTLQMLAATVGNAVSAAKGEGQAAPPIGAMLGPGTPEDEPLDEVPAHVAALAGEMYTAVVGGDAEAFGQLVTRCQAEIARDEWDVVGTELLAHLIEHEAAEIAATLRPVVAERAAILLTLPPAMALPMLSGFGIELTDDAAQWVVGCLAAIQQPPAKQT